jgi:HlyD family secretion protein
MTPCHPEINLVSERSLPSQNTPAKWWLLVTGVAVALIIGVVWRQSHLLKETHKSVVTKKSTITPLGVTALGRLLPAGDVRRLAAPSGTMGTVPRISQLYVDVGDQVRAGALLASFDSKVETLADIGEAKASINSLKERQKLLRIELARYQKLQQQGAVALEGVDLRQLKLLEIEQELKTALAQLKRQEVKLPFTELRAPFSGTILQIHVRSGERPGNKGVLDIGNSGEMEAELEVYESDIDRVKIGQRAKLRSENGGFSGNLNGRVFRIDPQVRQREVLSTDPTADTDARVVNVRIGLNPEDRAKVAGLTGLKVIGSLAP